MKIKAQDIISDPEYLLYELLNIVKYIEKKLQKIETQLISVDNPPDRTTKEDMEWLLEIISPKLSGVKTIMENNL